jgi:UTP:GlnB (protein PII) uridylyltransferase
VLNDWKADVLTDLYRRTMRHLAGEDTSAAGDDRAEASRSKIRAALRREEDLTWYDTVINSLPHDYLSSTPPAQVAAELRELHALPSGEVIARGRFMGRWNTPSARTKTSRRACFID